MVSLFPAEVWEGLVCFLLRFGRILGPKARERMHHGLSQDEKSDGVWLVVLSI
jgi:hypothetical protein